MILERNFVLLALFITKVLGNVSQEEAILGAATSSAVYASNLTNVERHLHETELVEGPYSCIGDLTCIKTRHNFKDSSSRLDMKSNYDSYLLSKLNYTFQLDLCKEIDSIFTKSTQKLLSEIAYISS